MREHENVEEHLGTLHRSEGGRVPAARLLHQVLDGREDVHEDVAAEHGERQQQQGRPAHRGGVSESLLNCLCHFNVLLFILGAKLIKNERNAKGNVKKCSPQQKICSFKQTKTTA